MPIKQLVALIPPPASPLDNEGNWYAAEIVVGATYPADFRVLIARYGSGAFFQGHLTVYNPLTDGGAGQGERMEIISPFRLRSSGYGPARKLKPQFFVSQGVMAHPSLRLKKVGGFWSARVGLHYRVLARDRAEGLVWFWIGPNSEYDRILTR